MHSARRVDRCGSPSDDGFSSGHPSPLAVSRGRLITKVLKPVSDCSGSHWADVARSNIIYLAKTQSLVRDSLDKWGALSVVVDEGRFASRQILQAFVTVPLDMQTPYGVVAPPQVMPEAHPVDAGVLKHCGVHEPHVHFRTHVDLAGWHVDSP